MTHFMKREDIHFYNECVDIANAVGKVMYDEFYPKDNDWNGSLFKWKMVAAALGRQYTGFDIRIMALNQWIENYTKDPTTMTMIVHIILTNFTQTANTVQKYEYNKKTRSVEPLAETFEVAA